VLKEMKEKDGPDHQSQPEPRWCVKMLDHSGADHAPSLGALPCP